MPTFAIVTKPLRASFTGGEMKRLEGISIIAYPRIQGGRPDIILERYSAGDTPKLESIIIGEVKYTESSGYAIQGLRELLEYIALIRKAQKEPYIVAKDKLFDHLEDNDIPIFGILFTDTIDGFSLKSSQNGGKNGIYLVKYPHKNGLSAILKNNSVLPPKSN